MTLIRKLVATSVFVSPTLVQGDRMDCGAGVPLCGTLTLETGLGSGLYHHSQPTVHGLWPEVGSYGDSKCIRPKDTAPPTQIYSCYQQKEDTQDHLLWFERHEWTKHGECAGAQSADDFFNQVCALAAAPLEVLEKQKDSDATFEAMGEALKDSGYPVWSLDEEEDQVMLSACAGSDGRWVLAEVADMPAKCSDGSPPAPAPGPAPSPPAPAPPKGGRCIPGKKGPSCTSDRDCAEFSGCLRCARSGACTDVPGLSFVEALLV